MSRSTANPVDPLLLGLLFTGRAIKEPAEQSRQAQEVPSWFRSAPDACSAFENLAGNEGRREEGSETLVRLREPGMPALQKLDGIRMDADFWLEAVEKAAAWKVLPQFLSQVHAQRLRLAAQAGIALCTSYANAYGRTIHRFDRALTAIAALRNARIPVAAFKGLGVIALVYGGDLRRRTLQDVDLLIRPSDLDQAVHVLQEHGFRPKGVPGLSEYARFVANAPRFAGNQAISLYDDQGGEIDLHWEVRGSGLQVTEILSRAVESKVENQTVPVTEPCDCLILSAHHAVRENFTAQGACRNLFDIQNWCLRFIGNVDEPRGWEGRCLRSGHAASILAAIGILLQFGNSEPAAAVAVSSALDKLQLATSDDSALRHAAELIRLFDYQLKHGPIDNDVLFLVHTRPWMLVLRGLSLGATSYLRSMRSMEAQFGQKRPFHKRLMDLGRTLPSIEGLRLARNLARVKFG